MWKYWWIMTIFYTEYSKEFINAGLAQTQEFMASGSISVSKSAHTAGRDLVYTLGSSLVNTGSVTDFQFNIFFNGTETVDSIDIITKGISMKFAHSQKSIYISTKFGQATGNVQTFLSNPKFNDNRTTAVTRLNNQGIVVESIYGNISMVASKGAPTAGPVRCEVTVIQHSKSNKEAKEYVFLSDPLVFLPPEMFFLEAKPKVLNMKDSASFFVNVSVPGMEIGNTYAKMYLPTTNESTQSYENEAKMSLASFEINEVYGLTPEKTKLLKSVRSSDFSSTGTSEKETAKLDFPQMMIPGPAQGGNTIINLKSEAKLQDYKGFEDNQILPVYVACKFNDDFIWVSRTEVKVADDMKDIEKIPDLNIGFFENTRYKRRPGLIDVRLRLELDHTKSSNGTAYNITVNFYIPPGVDIVEHSKNPYDIVKPYDNVDSLGKPCATDRVCHIELTRISFPHRSRYYFNVTLTFDKTKLTDFDIVYEVIYNGWRSSKELSTQLQILKLTGNHKLEDINISTEAKCPCPGFPLNRTCACCPFGACQCAWEDPRSCSSCQYPWHCIDTLPEYDKRSSMIKWAGGNSLICKNRLKLSPGKPWITCFKNNVKVKDRVTSPIVSALLGIDLEQQVLYGISNNGRGYVMSKDGGDTWHSIQRKVYHSAVYSSTYKSATFT